MAIKTFIRLFDINGLCIKTIDCTGEDYDFSSLKEKYPNYVTHRFLYV